MVSRQQVLKALQQFKEERGAEFGIVSLGIFGSFARNQATSQSDIDVVVETETVTPFQLVHLKDNLERLLNVHVDIVRKRSTMNEFLRKRIDKEAMYV